MVAALLAGATACTLAGDAVRYAARRETPADLDAYRDSIPVCHSAEQCDRMWSAARRWLAAVYPRGELTESESGSRMLMRESDFYDKSRSVQTRVSREKVTGSDYRIVIEIDYEWWTPPMASRMVRFNHDIAAAGGEQ